jgi:hypothetical protein
MSVPGGAGARLEGYAGPVDARRFWRLEQRVDADRAREILCRALARRLRTTACNLHFFDPSMITDTPNLSDGGSRQYPGVMRPSEPASIPVRLIVREHADRAGLTYARPRAAKAAQPIPADPSSRGDTGLFHHWRPQARSGAVRVKTSPLRQFHTFLMAEGSILASSRHLDRSPKSLAGGAQPRPRPML